MVNIRRTFSEAEKAGVICTETRIALVNIAKLLFYPHRQYKRILNKGTEMGLAAEELTSIWTWLSISRFDQKREDAVLMLNMMKHDLSRNCKAKCVAYKTENTEMWARLRRQAGVLVMREREG